jgi:hypothetical protein
MQSLHFHPRSPPPDSSALAACNPADSVSDAHAGNPRGERHRCIPRPAADAQDGAVHEYH